MSLLATFEGLSTGQKFLAIGGSLAVGLGVLSAFKKNGQTGSGQTASGSDSTGGDGGGLMPPVVEVPTPIMVPIPDSGPSAAVPVAAAPTPTAKTTASAPATTVNAPHVSSMPELISSGVSRTDAANIASRDTNIFNLATGAVPTAQVQTVKAAVASSDLHPTAANAANTTANPFGGFGGGNYYTDGAAVAQSIVANEQRIHSDPAFVQAELNRTHEVINNRVAAGVSTVAQVNYEHELQGLAHASGASTPRTSTSTMSAVDYSNQQKAKLEARAAQGDAQAATALKNQWY